ncbi:MAG: hypothetical protein AAFV33_06830 [Chloroflexota bacterium]
MSYKPFDPAVEVHGQPMQTFVECISKSEVAPILNDLGIDGINPEKWYPQQLWLDIFNRLTAKQQAFLTFVDIGMRTIELTRYPDEVKNIPFVDFMVHGANQTHQHNHRGGDAGEYQVSLAGDNHIVVKARVAYPDDFVYGCYYQLTKQFKPEDTDFLVKYDENEPKREDGGEYTVIHITWKSK